LLQGEAACQKYMSKIVSFKRCYYTDVHTHQTNYSNWTTKVVSKICSCRTYKRRQDAVDSIDVSKIDSRIFYCLVFFACIDLKYITMAKSLLHCVVQINLETYNILRLMN